jgi:hypothetical protein
MSGRHKRRAPAGMPRATQDRMRTMTTLTIMGLLAGYVAAAGAQAATHPDSGATTSATSLLTAERRAHDAAERLRVPAAGPARWKHGGEGWMPAWSAETKPREKQPAPD